MGYSAQAQKFTKKKRYWSLGGSLNAMNYAGDMDPGTFFISPALAYTRWNIGACVLYRYTERISLRGAFCYGRIQGDDRETQEPDISNEDASGWRYIRGTNFINDLFELKADIVYDFIENRGRYNKRVDWTPYVFGGLAYFYMNPTADYGQGSQAIKDVLPPDRSFLNHQIAIPLGLGVRFRVGPLIDLAFELGLRKTFTGYLDGTKGAYSDPFKMTAQQRLYDNPSMVGYGSDAGTTEVINKQGIYVFDAQTGQNLGAYSIGLGYTNEEIVSAVTPYLAAPERYIVTPFGFGTKRDEVGDKKAEFSADWYIVAGFHLTFILPERVHCPKYRD